MPATDDRWDVLVVGVRDPSHANAVMVVAELAHYASLPPSDVQRMLDEGELPVLSNLDRAEAERAAYELNELGAVVDLQLTDAGSGVFPVLKPDADRQVGVAVGGLIDDSATPPTVGESFGGLPEVEPDLEIPAAPRSRPTPSRNDGLSVTLGSEVHRMPTGNHRPVVTRGQGPEPIEASPYVEPAPRHELLTDHGPPGLGEEPILSPSLGERRPGEYGLHNADVPHAGRGAPRSSAGAPYERGAGPHAPSGPGGRHSPATPSHPRAQAQAQAQAHAKPRAQPQARSKKKSRPKMDGLLGEVGPSAVPESPKLPRRLERATAAAEQSEASLELDFEAAGIERPPPRFSSPSASSAVPGPMHQADHSAGSMPRRTRAAGIGGSGASAGGYSGQDSQDMGGVVDALRNDGVAALILGLGVGLVLSMVLAIQLQRTDVRDKIPPLEEELAASLSDPAGVEAGDRREVDVVEGELHEALDEIERKFLLLWLGVGLPVGVLLSRLRTL
ncbi:MAG: hypothetical protein AAGF11_06745 [Myxococcota bacterium]